MMRKFLLALTAVAILAPSAAYAHHVFDDVDDSRFFAEPVEWAFDNGITTGKTAAIFDPDGPVTRGEAVTFLKRYHDNIAAHLDTDTDTDTNSDTLADMSCPAGDLLVTDDDEWECRSITLSHTFSAVSLHPVDTGEDTGHHTSIVIGADGNPIIAHRNYTDRGVWVFACSLPDCSAGENHLLNDTADDLGGYIDIAIDPDGNPAIAYYNWTADTLELFLCDASDCSTGGSNVILHTEPGSLLEPALAFDGDDPYAFFGSSVDDNLYVVRCADADCGTVGTPSVVAPGGGSPDIAFADAGPLISHSEGGDLRLIVCADAGCHTRDARVARADADATYTSIAVGLSGGAFIGFYDEANDDLRLYACPTEACSSGITRTIADDGDVGSHVQILVDDDGLPVLIHHDNTNNDLDVAVCSEWLCADVAHHVLADTGNVGHWNGAVHNSNGEVVVSFDDATDAQLTVAVMEFSVSGYQLN